MTYKVPGHSPDTIIGAAGVVGELIDRGTARFDRFVRAVARAVLKPLDDFFDAAGFPPQPPLEQDTAALIEKPTE